MDSNVSPEFFQQHNPFTGHTIVRPPQIWNKSFPDVPRINAHASDAVMNAIKEIEKGELDTVGITILGERGLGKSQIISRIRHRLKANEKTLFIYMSKYDDLDQINYQFLQSIGSSLRAFGGYPNVMQWQEIATALMNDARQWTHKPSQYIQVFPNWLNKYSKQVVNQLTELVLKVKPEITNPYIVKAILWTLSPAHASYAALWLSGLELTQTHADEMGLPNPDYEQIEARALENSRQILNIISSYKVPVICFDELDNPALNEAGLTMAQVIALLSKNLCENLNRSLILLAMYAPTWTGTINVLPQAEAVKDRIASYPQQGKPIDLEYLNSDDVVAVAAQWLKEVHQKLPEKPSSPVYPFDEQKLRQLGKEKPTIRRVLKWCAENFEQGVATPSQAITELYTAELENLESVDVLDQENNDEVAKALKFGFSTLVNQTLEGVTIQAVEDIQAAAADYGYLHFKVVGQENGQTVKIGVCVLQHSGGKYQGAALKRLVDYEKFDLTRGCLVRSKELNSGAGVAQEKIKVLLDQKGGEWAKLQEQDIKPLMALCSLNEKWEESQESLDKSQFLDFINQEKLVIHNELIREILSDPSGQQPANLVNEDIFLSVPESQNSVSVADLSELVM